MKRRSMGAAMQATDDRSAMQPLREKPSKSIAELSMAVQKNVCVSLPLELLEQLEELLYRVNKGSNLAGRRYSKRELYILGARYVASLSAAELADLLAS